MTVVVLNAQSLFTCDIVNKTHVVPYSHSHLHLYIFRSSSLIFPSIQIHTTRNKFIRYRIIIIIIITSSLSRVKINPVKVFFTLSTSMKHMAWHHAHIKKYQIRSYHHHNVHSSLNPKESVSFM